MSSVSVFDNLWVDDLLDIHFHESLGGKLLKSADVDGAFFTRVEVAGPDTEVGGGADHSASQS